MNVIAKCLARSLLLLLSLGISLPAFATLRTIEEAYELTPGQVQLPASSTGGLTVRPCPTCSPVVLRVTGATEWFSSPREQPPAGQAAVLDALAAAGNRAGVWIYVYYEPQTLRVNRIVLDVPGGGAPP
jgi:hypothetical protein